MTQVFCYGITAPLRHRTGKPVAAAALPSLKDAGGHAEAPQPPALTKPPPEPV